MADINITRSKPLLGTFVEIVAKGPSALPLQEIITECFALIQRHESLLSRHIVESDISKINNLAPFTELTIHPLTAEILSVALSLTKATGGTFDVVVPDRELLSSSNDIAISNNTVMLLNPVKIDLGGIGKGFIVDKASDFLAQFGLTFFQLSAGGDLRFKSKEPAPLFIRDPVNHGTPIEIGFGTDVACATSSDYYRASHKTDFGLYNPRTGDSSYSGKSISVIGDSCTICDAMTKVIALDSVNKETYLEKFSLRAVEIE